MAYEWFPSFDAIPGVDWRPLIPLDRARLRGTDATPHVEEIQLLDERTFERVKWLTRDGREVSEESGSPAAVHLRTVYSEDDRAPRTIAERISQALALPGIRSEYHFGIMQACEMLGSARRRDPRSFGWIEQLCLADIRLIEQGAQLVFSESHWTDSEQGGYPIAPSFGRLSSQYQHEGYLAAAVEIEKRCAALGVARPVGEEAIARQAALLEEDGR